MLGYLCMCEEDENLYSLALMFTCDLFFPLHFNCFCIETLKLKTSLSLLPNFYSLVLWIFFFFVMRSISSIEESTSQASLAPTQKSSFFLFRKNSENIQSIGQPSQDYRRVLQHLILSCDIWGKKWGGDVGGCGGGWMLQPHLNWHLDTWLLLGWMMGY